MTNGNDYESAILARQDWQEIEDDGEAMHFIHTPATETESPYRLTVNDLLVSSLVDDKTMITISAGRRITAGKWFEDNILEYLQREIQSFDWSSGNTMFIELKKEV